MRREQRLRRRREFAVVYRRGRRYQSQLLLLRALRTDGPESRFGFSVGQELGSAVVRNRVKRRLREVVRSLPVSAGWQMVINARPPAATASYQQLRGTLADLFARAGALAEQEGRE